VRRLALVSLASLAVAASAGATPTYVPNDPLFARQWYVTQDHAFDTWSTQLPTLAPVGVAVIDSGIDLGHPEFEGRIRAEKSFVGGTITDHQGHGTFVAGEIAAALDNGQGIAGIAFPAELIIAKVVAPDGTIAPETEAKAIRWAVDQGARVVNLSIGGLRDPRHPARDTFSPVEENAVEYARSHDAVVVAAVGNADEAPTSPWPYASYPAALPHVIGVSSLSQDGAVSSFSNRDPIYNDISAPGEDMLSTFPRWITAQRPSCVDQGYSDCGPIEYAHARGTSFSAPQVSAAAALLLAAHPRLTADQVASLLEQSADDANAANGCDRCPPFRDALSGWGRLDIAAALQAADGPLPPPDHYEANDDAGRNAQTVVGRSRELTATIDFWDDQIDVYRVKVRTRQRITAALAGPSETHLGLILWKPGTQHVEGLAAQLHRRATAVIGSGAVERLAYRAKAGGWYFLEVKITAPGYGPYTLRITKKG
jgi:subtilisin family serine protease